MDRFLKPQAPIKDKESDYIYPLTTVDQIIGDNDRRLNIILEDDFAKKDEVSSAKTEAIDSSKVYTNEQVKRAAPRNLLDNSDFTNPVNQRGKTSYSGPAGYTIDRWKTTNDTSTVTLENGGLVLSNDSSTCYLQQYVCNSNLLLGKWVTLAATLEDGSVVCASAKLPAAFPSGYQTVALIKDGAHDVGHILISSSSFSVRLQSTSDTRSRTFKNVALYVGEYTAETLPEYQPKGYTEEFMICQRYYLPLKKPVRYPTTRVSNSDIYFIVPIPTTLFKTPTLIGTLAVLKGATEESGFTFAVASTGDNAIAVSATKSNHGLGIVDNLSLQFTDGALSADIV